MQPYRPSCLSEKGQTISSLSLIFCRIPKVPSSLFPPHLTDRLPDRPCNQGGETARPSFFFPFLLPKPQSRLTGLKLLLSFFCAFTQPKIKEKKKSPDCMSGGGNIDLACLSEIVCCEKRKNRPAFQLMLCLLCGQKFLSRSIFLSSRSFSLLEVENTP